MVRTFAKALHHAAAHDAPAQRAHHFPEFDTRWIDLPPSRLIAGEQLLTRAKAADRLVDLAKAPGVDADPAEILHGIAEMSELPIEHGTDPVGADDEIAVAEIAMHQRRLGGRTRIVVAQPAQRQFEHRLWPVQAAIVAIELADLLGCAPAAQPGQFIER